MQGAEGYHKYELMQNEQSEEKICALLQNARADYGGYAIEASIKERN